MSSISRRQLLALGAGAAFGKTAGPKPNIVVILADDLGYGDVHFQNPQRSKLPTPCIDRLAGQGMAFSDAHSGSAVCTPTRYGILTGRYAWRSRLQKGVLGPYAPPLIPASQPTLASLLRSVGYRTACVGKWHLGWNWPREGDSFRFDRPITGGPTAIGFDSYFGTDVPNYPPYCFIENQRTVGIPSVDKPKRMYGVDGLMVPGWRLEGILPGLVARASKFVEESAKAKTPFFLYLPLTSPHTPLAVAEEWRGRSGLGLYGDWVMQTDASVGAVVDALDRSGAAGETLVLFTSDNGCAPYVGVERDDRKGRVQDLEARGHYPSAGWRGYKSDIWEGGHRIPLVARWPGRIRAGSKSNDLVCLTDIFATAAEVAGARVPDQAGQDSVSFLASFGGRRKRREPVVHHSIDGKFAVREGRWKLALCAGSGGWSQPTDRKAAEMGLPPVQLYDLEADPGERKNLESRHQAQVKRLTARLERIVAEGRSTPGARSRNDVAVDVWKRGASVVRGSDD